MTPRIKGFSKRERNGLLWDGRSLGHCYWGLVKDTAGLPVADQGTWQDWPKLAADCASFGDERFKQAKMVHREAVPLWVGSVGL
jgi:hypothetical protein